MSNLKSQALGLVLGITFSGSVAAQENIKPVLGKDNTSLDEGGSKIVNVLANDSDPDGDKSKMRVVGTQDVNFGTATINPDNTITITANVNSAGSSSFLYTVEDEGGARASQRVNVTINPVEIEPDPVPENNQPPVLQKKNLSLIENEIRTYNVMAGAYDPDGDDMRLTGVQDVTFGQVVINNDNTITLAVNPNSAGSTSFLYNVTDEHGAVATQRVNVVIEPDLNAGNQPPVYNGKKYNVELAEGVSTVVCFTDSLRDPDDDKMFIYAPNVPFGALNMVVDVPENDPSHSGLYHETCLEITPIAGSATTQYPKQSGEGKNRFYVAVYDEHENQMSGTIPVDVTITDPNHQEVNTILTIQAANIAGYSDPSDPINITAESGQVFTLSFDEPKENIFGLCLTELYKVNEYKFNFTSANAGGSITFGADSMFLTCDTNVVEPIFCDGTEPQKRCEFKIRASDDAQGFDLVF